MPVVLVSDQHEVRRGAADFRTGHHQLEVRRLGVLATSFKTVAHSH
jgi:hypothetical protein